MYEKLKFEYARDSLKYLIQRFQIKELHIPYYLCDVVRHSVIEAGCKPVFYHIDNNFFPAKDFNKEDFILYPNYFGICEDNAAKLEKIYPNLIIDNVHAYYMSPQGMACFNSKRKFIPGQIVSELYVKKEGESAENQPIRPDEKRREEFKILNKKYGKTNLLVFKKVPLSPFCYPYLAGTNEEADKLAENLIEKGETIYRYWNNLPRNYN